MTWEHPQILYALWLLPVLAALLIRAAVLRRRAASRFAGPWLVDRLVPRPARWLVVAKGLALLLGIALLIVALARPRFGEAFEEVRARGIDLVILLDVSRSMLAEDAAPNRLRRATSDLRDLLPKLEGDRVALVAFAGVPAVRVPLTTDHDFIRQMLDSLDADVVTRGGSALGDAVRKALEVLPEVRERDQAILLLTDGEDHESFPRQAARRAAERGVKLFVVGLGDPVQGARIPLRDEQGNLRYLQHEGQEVWSRVDRELLTELALATEGAYVPAHTRAYDLGQLYEDHLRQLTRGELHGGRQRLLRDQFPRFLWLGLALLLLETLLPNYPRKPAEMGENSTSQRRTPMLPQGSTTTAAAPSSGSAPATRSQAPSGAISTLLIAAALCLLAPAAVQAQSAAERAREGVRHYEREEYVLAERSFARAHEADPDNKRHAFNRGCALAAQGRLADALPWFEEAATSPNPSLAARAQFNVAGLLVGQAAELAGDEPAAVPAEQRSEVESLCEQAVAAYRRAMERMPAEESRAREQLEQVRAWLNRTRQLWQEEDRRKQREQDLLAYLRALRKEFARGRSTLVPIVEQWPSPRRRQIAFEQARAVRELRAELDHLEARLLKQLESGGQATADSPAPFGEQTPHEPQPRQWVRQELEQCRAALDEAAAQLEVGQLAAALESHASADDRLNELFLAVCPFDALLREAIDLQEQLVRHGRNEHAAAPTAATAADSESSGSVVEPAHEQNRITQWSQALRAKALEELSRLPREGPELPADSLAPRDSEAPESDAGSEPQEAPARRDVEAPSSARAKTQTPPATGAWEAAVRLTPEIEQRSRQATDDLNRQDADAALPRQERALELLREIARTLPPPADQQSSPDEKPRDEQQSQDEKPSPDEQQPRDQQRSQDQQSQDQQSQDQQSQDQQSQDQQSQEDKQRQDSSDTAADSPSDSTSQNRGSSPEEETAGSRQDEQQASPDQPVPDQPSQDGSSEQQPDSPLPQDRPEGRRPEEEPTEQEQGRQEQRRQEQRRQEQGEANQQPARPGDQPGESGRTGPEEGAKEEGRPPGGARSAGDQLEREAALRQMRETETILRQARERQQRYAELLRALRARMRGAAKVEKDW